MLSVSNTALCPDDEQPGPAGTNEIASRSASIGPDYPSSGWSAGGFGHHARRIAAPFVVVCAVALVVVGVADVHVARDRNEVDRDVATARVAADRVADHLAGGDYEAVGNDLDLLARAGTNARSGSVGFGWTVADRSDLFGGQVRDLRREAARIATLAAQAGPLRAALAPLLTNTAASETAASGTTASGTAISGATASGLYALDDLARGLSRYATAAERGGDPSAPAIGRAALVAGMLPALAGADGPRTWTICRVAAGPCFWINVTDARSSAPMAEVAPGTVSPPGRRWAAGVDVMVVGVDPSAIFTPNGSFDAAAVFDLLYHVDSATVRSAVASEQQAIDRLSHR
ncbi:MAG TPA: hypothetical protein VLL08_23255 [Kineosporiaceae bacterium]|nr:hypothetical protein [Kineosporiaceae bacterium]